MPRACGWAWRSREASGARPRSPRRAAAGSAARAAGDADQADRRSQLIGPRPQVHEQAQHPDRRRHLKHTGDELLECKNFGVTSLNEVRDKLQALNLKLKND